jgi:hypothetical protein
MSLFDQIQMPLSRGGAIMVRAAQSLLTLVCRHPELLAVLASSSLQNRSGTMIVSTRQSGERNEQKYARTRQAAWRTYLAKSCK